MRPARPRRRAANLFFGCTCQPPIRQPTRQPPRRRRNGTKKPHRFPAQLCEQDFDAYEEAVISDESMNRVASLLDNESPRAPDPRR